jgi:predicted  nucleic acid-binding Zn-ribbon protein
MAVTGLSIELVSRYLDLDSCESDDLSCENCVTLKLYLQILNNELKSVQLTIKLLQEDKLNNINLEKRDIPFNQTYADIVANRVKTTNQDNKSGTNNDNKLTNIVLPKVKLGKKHHRIVILGDSHVKGMATELKHSLNDDFEAIGIAKPGSMLVNITKSTCSDIKTLKKTDVCVIWGGTNDIGKNDTSTGVSAMYDLVKLLKNTNVIVINVPNRHDLSPRSCVNNEVQTFNRKIGNVCKIFENVLVLPVDLGRDLFTRHGLCLNTKVKEHLALKVALMIKNLLTRKKNYL